MQWLTRRALRSPRATLLLLAAVSAAALAGVLRLETDVGYAAFLGSEHPAVRDFDEFLERFGGGYPIAIVWSCRATDNCEFVFDADSLRMAAQVSERLAALPSVRRVESPATSLLLTPSDDGVVARRIGADEPDRAVLAGRAIADPLWVGGLISEDARVGAIVVELVGSDSATSLEVYSELEAALAPFRARGYRYNLVGGPIDFVVAGSELRRATERQIPVVGILLAGVVWLLVRSFAAVIMTLGSAAVAVLWTLGLLGWLGWPQNTLTQTLPPLVLVISACHGLHVLWRYASELEGREGREGGDDPDREARSAALIRSAADIGGPCVITTLTTAGAFLSFVTSGLESFVRFGVVSSAGVLFTLVLSFTLLPILLRGTLVVRGQGGWERAVGALTRLARRAPVAILAVALALGAWSAFGLPRLEVDVRYEDLYGEHSRVVRWVRFVEANLRAPETLEIEIALPEGERVSAPEIMQRIEAFETFVEGVDGLGRAQSVLDPLRWMNRLVHEDDERFQRIGRTARENAGLLLLLGGATSLDPWLTLDQRNVRLSVEARKVPQPRLRALLAEVRSYIDTELPAAWQVSLTGPAVLVHSMVEEIKQTQLYSFATAAAVVLVLVALFLRSFRWAILAMIPTGLPVLMTLGVMGFAGVNLDVGTAMVAAVVIGIAIDDTVHLLAQYRRRRAAGLDPATAIEESVAHVARALITTSTALALGFLSLLLSPWSSVANFGVVAAVAIVAALVADLLVLPALILSLGRTRVA